MPNSCPAVEDEEDDRETSSSPKPISGGKFHALVTPGAKRVEIRASRTKRPDKNDPNSAGLHEDFIPAQFNTASTLTAEISAEEANKLSFNLSVK